MQTQPKLDKNQLAAVKHSKGPLLIIAGAGTGKTTVITERVKYLVLDKKVNPSKILALTFTEKAANEMEERIDRAMPYGYTQMWISTFHSFCDRVLRNESIHIGLNPSYRLLTEAESILLLRKNLFSFDLNYFRPLTNPNKFLSALLQHFSRLKDEDISVDDYLNFLKKNKDLEKDELAKYMELAKAYKTYEELKIKEGVMDFSDLISNTLTLFRKRKNILRDYQNQFDYVLVDEFQDTNYAQNELAILLSDKSKNINVVGDDDQSIYRFRGSSISNIIQFKKRFPKTKIVTLIKNYRSTEEILDTSYKLIQHNNPDRLEIKEKINKKLTSARKIKGEKIEFIFKERVEDEADEVARKIKKLIENKKEYQYKDVAILVRANDHAESFIKAMERLSIPYQFLGPGRLFHQEEIKDLVSYLKVLYNFEDSSSLYRILTMSIFGLEGIEISTLLNLAKRKNYTLFESLEKVDETFLKEETKEKIKKIHAMIKRHINLIPKETAGQILYFFLEDSGMLNKIVDYKTFTDEKIAKNIAKFFDKLRTFEVDHQSATVYEIVDWIDLSMQTGESPLAADMDWTENNAVNLLTVHSSKGLEFPIVFIVNLVSQRFPTRERTEKIPIPKELIKEILPEGDFHQQEERRLFYVGMTRAEDFLFLTGANFYGEGKKEKKISPFVVEALGEREVESKIKKGLNEKAEIQLSLLDWSKKEEKPATEKWKPTTPVSYLSYSQIQTFDICPLHYKLKYILKIPTPQTSSQSFGTSLHAVLRDLYQNYKLDKKITDVDELFDKNWINEGYLSKVHEKKTLAKGKKIVELYIKNNFDRKNLPTQLEYPFNFNLENLKIGGRIDRIDSLSDGKIEIIDYKTGENIPTARDMENNFQLTFYALAATEIREQILNRKPQDILLSLYYIEKDIKLTTIRTKEQLEDAKLKILEKAKEISKSEFLCSGSIFCKNCEYKMLCSTLS